MSSRRQAGSGSQVQFVPVRPGVYRRIWRKKPPTSRRKPVGPPLQFTPRPPVGGMGHRIPFRNLPDELQRPCGRDLSAGAGVEERMDALCDMIDEATKE